MNGKSRSDSEYVIWPIYSAYTRYRTVMRLKLVAVVQLELHRIHFIIGSYYSSTLYTVVYKTIPMRQTYYNADSQELPIAIANKYA